MDVLCNMSGIFRDSFQNVVELLDDLFRNAAKAEEPADQNFIRSALHSNACCMVDLQLQSPAYKAVFQAL